MDSTNTSEENDRLLPEKKDNIWVFYDINNYAVKRKGKVRFNLSQQH